MVKKGSEFNRTVINNNCRATAKIYLEAGRAAETIVKESYEESTSGQILSFPVNIDLITQHCKISVAMSGLNQSKTQSSRVLAVLICHENDVSITVDDKVGYKTRRYAIANAVARYLLKSKKSVFTSTYAIPLIPQSLEEISADMIALFMLMPMGLFKDEFRKYIESNGDRPMDVDRWLEYLSDRTQISQFNLAIGYQQMKMALCYERQEQLKEEGYMDEEDDSYATIFA